MLKRLTILILFTLALATPAQATPRHCVSCDNEGTHYAAHRLVVR